MPKPELVATRGFKYMTRRLLPGDVFEAKNAMEAKILTDVRRVAAVPLPKPARKAPAEEREAEPERRVVPVIPTVDEILTAEVVEEAPAREIKPKPSLPVGHTRARRKAKK